MKGIKNMKFKRTIASVLTAIFSLTLMGASTPKSFAEQPTEIITEEKIDVKSKEKTNEQNKIDDRKEENDSSFKKGIKNILKHPISLVAHALVGLAVVAVADHVIVNSINTIIADQNNSSKRLYVPKISYAIAPLILVLLEAIDLYNAG